MRRFFMLTVLLSTFTLGACGTRGPLTLPPPQSKAPTAAAGSQPVLASIDLNTAKEPS